MVIRKVFSGPKLVFWGAPVINVPISRVNQFSNLLDFSPEEGLDASTSSAGLSLTASTSRSVSSNPLIFLFHEGGRGKRVREGKRGETETETENFG